MIIKMQLNMHKKLPNSKVRVSLQMKPSLV